MITRRNCAAADAPTRDELRLRRQFRVLQREIPVLEKPIDAMLARRGRLLRLPLAILLILGGVLAILPFFGLWMLPLGFLLLSIDIAMLRGPVCNVMIRGRMRLRAWRARRST